ncbi:hypothetical protein MGG_17951 [Pyricularia oryzae 70-15]|uniref:Uncharacterized protein n=1 Tax=Pyricularia oryzae (strain 70-15 / ATCC MYA-4617 / FGSC 8958) TaxID=242507 RepID=G4NLT8_PYRO7|nr:uncharacterized protein MGG_17951 [Pyricularia oryzae 70-15]EHA46141.1 hypothetical protein MGG_17951 [Pyricularia oryzae 70-15]
MTTTQFTWYWRATGSSYFRVEMKQRGGSPACHPPLGGPRSQVLKRGGRAPLYYPARDEA